MSTLPKVLLIGAGGLGSPVLFALGGRVEITVVDDDEVGLSNLQRQIIYRQADVGRLKVEVVQDAFAHRGWPVTPVRARLDGRNAAGLVADHDVVVDGSDSFATKFMLNDVCLELGVPLVHGAVMGWNGQLMPVVPGHSCYRCVFENPPEQSVVASCRQTGVVGAVCGVIGGLMAREALAILEGQPTLLGAMLIFDGLRDSWRKITPRPRAGCPAHSVAKVASW
jgi:molybdopterin/thiamine biosynthesis adenylyltransferase